MLKNESLCLEAEHCIHCRMPLCNIFQLDLMTGILLFASCGHVATRNKKMNKSWALPQGDRECEQMDAKINSAQDLLGILKLPLMGQIIVGRCYWSLMSEASGERRRKHLFPTWFLTEVGEHESRGDAQRLMFGRKEHQAFLPKC